MFVLSKWNQTKTYNFDIERDFGTDYGICCWYTPQINFTEIHLDTVAKNLSEPDWGHFFMNVPKAGLPHLSQKRLLYQNCAVGFENGKG